MRKFNKKQSVPGMKGYTKKAVIAVQMDEDFEVDEKEGKGKPGDYLVKIQGELYVSEKAIFESVYDLS